VPAPKGREDSCVGFCDGSGHGGGYGVVALRQPDFVECEGDGRIPPAPQDSSSSMAAFIFSQIRGTAKNQVGWTAAKNSAIFRESGQVVTVAPWMIGR
jgi:hypothetical protein